MVRGACALSPSEATQVRAAARVIWRMAACYYNERMTTTVPASGSVVASVAYSNGRKIGEVALDDISDVLERADTFVWIGLYEPNEPLLRKMQEEFALHDLSIEDALSAHQRPKVERYDDSVFVVLRTAQIESGSLPCAIQ